MAQYDGSIRINTNINTDGIAQGMSEIRRVIERSMSGSKPMQNTEQQVKQLGDSMSDTAKKASEFQNAMGEQGYAQNLTKEAKEVQKEIDSLQKKLLSVYDSQERFLATGGKEDSSAYRKMVYDAETLESKLQKAEQAMEALVSSGKAFTIGADSDAEYWKQQEENIDRVIARMEERQRIEAETPPELLQPKYDTPEVESWQRGVGLEEGQREAQALADAMASVGQNTQDSAAKSNEAIASMTQELSELKARQKELESQGQGLGFEEYDANVQRIAEINDALSDYRRELTDTSSSYMNLKEVAQNTLKMMAKGLVDIPTAIVKVGIRGITSAVRELGNVVQKSAIAPLKLLGATAKKILSSIGKSSKTSNNLLNKSFKNILKYGLGIRSVYMLINKFRTAVKEGFKNLAQVSEPVNESLSMLKSSLTQLKNSLATAFAPILTAIAPALTTLINMISQAATYVGMFIATLTGASSFTKAIAVQEDYAASLNKTGSAAKKAAGALAKFDDLDVLSKPASGGGGAGAAETPVADMFEEVEIPNKFKDTAQWIKDMWAESDFTELGSFLGERLKESLDNIPWDSIQEKARNIGASLATLINGAVETDGLGYTIGNTLAQGINTAFNFLNSFVHNLNWQGIGTFIAESLNGLFQNIDWNLIYDTFVTGAKGLGDAINSFMETLDWETVASTVSNFVNTFVDTVYTFFATVDWAGLGEKVGKFLSGALAGINWENLGVLIGTYFQSIYEFILSTIENIDWESVGTYIADSLNGVFEFLNLSTLGELLGTAFTGLFDMAIGFAKEFDWKKLGDNISGGINGFFEKFDGAKLAKAATGLISGLLDTIIETVETTDWAAIWEDIIDFLVNVNWLELIGKLALAAVELVGGLVVGLIEAIAETDWGAVWDSIVQAFKEFFGINSPSTLMMEMGAYLIEGLIEGINGLVESVSEIWEGMKETASEIWQNVKDDLSEKWESTKENAEDTWETIKKSLSEKCKAIDKDSSDTFENMKKNVSDIFSGMWDNIKGVINSILGGVEKMANGVVDAINTVIRALNGLSFEIPEFDVFGKKLGGTTIGFDISEIPNVNIPRLANGAVIRGGNPFMAVLGDQPAGKMNIEAPADLIKDMARQGIREELSNMNLGGNFGRSVGQVISLNVNGEEFARLTMGDFLKEMGRQGYDVQVLGVN